MDIQSVIKKYGYTIQKVAEKMPNSKDKGKVGISQGSLSTIINGNPTISTLQAIATIIGCNVSDFFADENKDFCAFVKNGTEHYHADNIEELKGIITKIEKEGK